MKLNDSSWILLKCTNLWHLEDPAHFFPRASGWEVLGLFKGWSFPALVAMDQGFVFLGGGVIHGGIQYFWKSPDQQSGKWNILLAISSFPSEEQGQQTAHVSLLALAGQSPAPEHSRIRWYCSHLCLLSPGSWGGTTFVPFPKTDAPLIHMPCATQKSCVTASVHYLAWVWTQRWNIFCILLLYPWAILMTWISFFK